MSDTNTEDSSIKTTNIIQQINKLPVEIINIIKEFIPKIAFVFTNRENYRLYHSLLLSYITNYEGYIRDTIRRDNEFVFTMILRENHKKWYEIKKYKYKNMIFTNYLYFIIHYCMLVFLMKVYIHEENSHLTITYLYPLYLYYYNKCNFNK